MMHVKQIREIVEAGRNEEAHDALDQLLALGPQNIEALKLRARLLEFEGRFPEESLIWERVVSIDREDPDAISYLLRRQLEDREHFYFTDDVPGGGRRFMAYPRSLINTSALGLVGCIAFLVSTRLALTFPVLNDPIVMLSTFGLLVILPWISIITTYFTCIKSISVSHQGVMVSTRLKLVNLKWNELETVCLARWSRGERHQLSLVLIPKEKGEKAIEIDLNQGSTAIRARSYLVREIARSWSEPQYGLRDKLDLDSRKLLSF